MKISIGRGIRCSSDHELDIVEYEVIESLGDQVTVECETCREHVVLWLGSGSLAVGDTRELGGG